MIVLRAAFLGAEEECHSEQAGRNSSEALFWSASVKSRRLLPGTMPSQVRCSKILGSLGQ